jgi:hypothetical protein
MFLKAELAEVVENSGDSHGIQMQFPRHGPDGQVGLIL